MAALRDHKRLASLVQRTAQRALVAVSDPPVPEPIPPEPEPLSEPEPERSPGPEPGAPARFARAFGPSNLACHETGASRKLYERLDAGDVAEVERLIAQTPELLALYESKPDPGTRRHMILAFGVWLGVPAVPREDWPVLEYSHLRTSMLWLADPRGGWWAL